MCLNEPQPNHKSYTIRSVRYSSQAGAGEQKGSSEKGAGAVGWYLDAHKQAVEKGVNRGKARFVKVKTKTHKQTKKLSSGQGGGS